MKAQLHALAPGRRALEDHAPLAGEAAIERARELAEPLRGARVLHVSAAAPRGRTPELLGSLLPLMRGAGVEADWRVLFGDAELRAAGRALHDGAQGGETGLGDAEYATYARACEEAAAALHGEYDAVIVHDPQPLAAMPALEQAGPVVWRCHVDASEADAGTAERLAPLAERCAERVFAVDSFELPGVAATRAIPPAIDPLGAANVDVPVRLAGRLLRSLGVDLERPFVCQVARLDPWKDPHAVIDAFDIAHDELPDLQLVLAGAPAPDDPEGWRTFKEISDYASGHDDVHLVTAYTGAGNVEFGAIRRLARASVQRSLREGFGLAVSEALWKGTPVVAGPAGGIPLQVRDGREGFLAEEDDAIAARIVELVRDPGLAIELGAAGRERVRERFLLTRLLADELDLLQGVASRDGATVESG
jgi:trehalose synthase